MTIEVHSNFEEVRGAKIHYLEAGKTTSSSILFLHGASFNAQTWVEIGTFQFIAEQGYRTIAVDLPGYGRSQSPSVPNEAFLLLLMEVLNITKPIVVSPSMSGSYSLPVVANYPDHLQGFVAVAPVRISQFSEQLQGVPLPTLAIWGSNDRIVPVTQADLLIQLMPNAGKIILENAGHACYMRATHEFNQHLLQFAGTVFSPVE